MVQTKRSRSVVGQLGIIIALLVMVSGSLSALTGWAQDSGAASFTVASASGNVVIKRADGSSETARPGTQLYANDQLASVGRSEAALNAVGPGGTSGASLLLYSDTTIGVRNPGAGAGTFYVADIAQGVVVARTPPNSGATLQITNESAGAVAQVNPGGGMAVASDVGTGTVAVSCEDRTSQVYFPYTDMRVPCENNVVRTLSNQRSIEDSRADANSPLTAAVQAAGTNVAAVQQSENAPQGQSQGAANRSNSTQDDDEEDSDAPAIVPSPAPFLHTGPSRFTIDLTWGSRPADLDTHLSFPPHGPSDFVAYFQQAPVPFVRLSPDITNSGGPETIAITRDPATGQFRPGEYRFWVHNYSHGVSGSPDTFAVSGAQVVVHRDSQALGTFSVGNASGSPSDDIWYVFILTLDSGGGAQVSTVQRFQSGTQNTVLCVDDSGGCGEARPKQ